MKSLISQHFFGSKMFKRQIILTLVILYSVIIFMLANISSPSIIVEDNEELKLMPFIQQVSECACSRPYFYPPKPNQVFKSTCSDEGTSHESRQRVVTFTMHYFSSKDKDRQKLYKEGILLNLKRMREYYPGYSMRLYTDVPLENDYCKFMCDNPDLFWCDINKTPLLGNMSLMYFPTWRFLTLADPTVNLFLSRDLDSAIIEREVGAVRDWLRLGKPIHLLRDKQKAHNIPILAGMWGARNDLLGPELATKLRDTIIKMSKEMMRYKGTDQTILNKVIYYPMKKEIVAYDSYHCELWKKDTLVRPFPLQRKDNTSDFIGNYDLGRKVYKYLPVCPKECRPSYGKDWEFC